MVLELYPKRHITITICAITDKTCNKNISCYNCKVYLKAEKGGKK